MIFVDTNYFLRYLLNDVKSQHLDAKRLLKDGASGKVALFTSTIVFFEIYWVLKTFYQQVKLDHTKSLENVLKLEFIELVERQILRDALGTYAENNLDLEDCYNLAYAKLKGAKGFKTFDVKLGKMF